MIFSVAVGEREIERKREQKRVWFLRYTSFTPGCRQPGRHFSTAGHTWNNALARPVCPTQHQTPSVQEKKAYPTGPGRRGMLCCCCQSRPAGASSWDGILFLSSVRLRIRHSALAKCCSSTDRRAHRPVEVGEYSRHKKTARSFQSSATPARAAFCLFKVNFLLFKLILLDRCAVNNGRPLLSAPNPRNSR